MHNTPDIIEKLVLDIIEDDPPSEAQAPTMRAAMLLMLRDDEIEREDTASGDFR